MDRDLLEQLVVPQPPYRMARPAVLLAAEPPPMPAPEKPIPAPEEPLEIPSELLEPIDEAAIESVAVQEKERIATAPALQGATAQELEQDAANRERAALEVDVAVAQETAEARARTPVKEGKDAEEMTTTERQGNQELAARLRAERDQQRMEAGIDFPQAKPEAANEKVARLSQEALQALNDFKEATDRKAKPEEIDFAKQRVNIAQRKLEAAKLGEPIPEERATVTAPASPPAAPAPGPSEPAPAVGDKTPYGEVIAVSPEGKPKIRYEAPAVTPPLSEGELRQKKFAEKSVTEKKKQVTRDQTAALKEEAARSAVQEPEEVAVDMLRPADEPVRPNEVGRQQDVPQTGLEEAFDAEGNLNLVPLPERPAVAQTREEAEQVLDERAQERAQAEGMGTARRETAEPNENERLRDEVSQLRAQLEALRTQQGSGGEQPPGGTPESGEPAGEDEEEEDPYRLRQAAEQEGDIEDLGTEEGLSFFEKWSLEREAGSKDWKAVFSQAFAQWSGNSVAYRDKQIKEWERRGAASAKRGLFGTAKSWLWHEAWGNWHKFWGRRAYKSWEGWDNARVVAENGRDELLNQGAARIDNALKSFETKADQYAVVRDDLDAKLKGDHKKHELLGAALAESRGPIRDRIQQKLADLEAGMKQDAIAKGEAEEQWKLHRKRAAGQRKRKQSLLTYAVRPARIDTTPVDVSKYDWMPLQQRKTRPGGSPKPGPRAKKVERKLAA